MGRWPRGLSSGQNVAVSAVSPHAANVRSVDQLVANEKRAESARQGRRAIVGKPQVGLIPKRARGEGPTAREESRSVYVGQGNGTVTRAAQDRWVCEAEHKALVRVTVRVKVAKPVRRIPTRKRNRRHVIESDYLGISAKRFQEGGVVSEGLHHHCRFKRRAEANVTSGGSTGHTPPGPRAGLLWEAGHDGAEPSKAGRRVKLCNRRCRQDCCQRGMGKLPCNAICCTGMITPFVVIIMAILAALVLRAILPLASHPRAFRADLTKGALVAIVKNCFYGQYPG